MRMSTPSIPCTLGKITPQSPASPEELATMRAAAWHKQGVVVIPIEEIRDTWDREFLTAIAVRMYGQRKESNKSGDPK